MSEAIRPGFLRLRLLGTICTILTICLSATPAISQILYGSIVGVVRDAQGANVPGATVTIINKETNLTRDTVTNAEGAYSLLSVLPGQYDVKVGLQGFRENVRSNVPVTIGQISRVDMALEIGTLTETVTVASAAQLLQTDKADVSTELRSAEITSIPLNRFRNYQALVNLVPGTTPMAFGNAETDTPARSLATNVNGQANTNNSTRTDGATNMNIWLPNHNMYISPAETIDTVQISTSSFDAEQGMAGGAAVTVITKSGTNNFRGSAFEFFMNEKMNATPYYFGTAAVKPGKLPLEQNNFGGTLGGPISKNKVFFFSSFEGYKRANSLFTFFDVPTAAMRNGDFSAATNNAGTQQTIYNPFTGNADGSGREAFANNQIPANLLNPKARLINDLLYPLPNTTGSGLGGLTRNYQREETRTVDRKNYDVKVNFNRTQAHQLWAKYAFMDAVVDDLTNYLGPDPNATGDGGFTKVYSLTAGQTWTLKPTLLLDTTFGFARQKQDVLGPDFDAGNFGLDVLGIPGTNDQGTGDQRYAGYPVFNTGLSAVGNRDGWNPIFRDERTYSLAANLAKLHGRHDFRGGYTMNFLYLDHWQPESNNPRGNFNFAGNATRLNAAGAQTSNLYNTYAAFMMGLTSSVAKSVQNELMTGREWQHALYVRDNWTVSPKLTVNLGLRWEYYPIMTRADGRGLERLDLQTLEVILGGRGGNPKNVGLEPGLGNFAPRVGGVYRLNDQTVLRSGYGITYNAMGWARPLRGDQEYPVTIFSNFTQGNTFGFYNRLEQGIPLITGPDQSTGRVPLPNAAGMVTPEVGNVDRGRVQTWNAAFERQLPWDVTVDIAYVGAKGDGGYAWVDINLPTTYGGGAQQPAVQCHVWPSEPDPVLGPAAAYSLRLAAGRLQPVVQPGIHGQGRIHAQQVHERVGQRRPDRADLGASPRAGPQLGGRWIRPHAQPAVGLRVSAAVAERGQRIQQYRPCDRRRLAAQRVARSVQRHAVHGHGRRGGREYARHPADSQSQRRVQRARRHRRSSDATSGSIRPSLLSRPASPSATRDATSSVGRARGTSTSRCSAPSRWAVSGSSSSGSRGTTSSITRCSRIRTPASPARRLDRSPASLVAVD